MYFLFLSNCLICGKPYKHDKLNKLCSFGSRVFSNESITIQSNLRLRPPLVTDHLSSGHVFQNTKSFQVTLLYLEPLVSDCDHFWS